MSMKPEDVKPEEEVKSEEMQLELQPEMQLPVSDVKPKRFALKPIKRSALKPSKLFALKPIRQKRSASEIVQLKAKSEPITLENLPVLIQMNGQKYIKLMKHQNQVVVNMREYITDQSSGKLHPTKKGIILSLKDWQSLKKEMKTVNKLLRQL